MNGFKKCSNGHFFKQDLASCPFCPGAASPSAVGSSNSGAATVVQPGSQPSGGSDLNKTQVGTMGGSMAPTMGDSVKTAVFAAGNGGSAGGVKTEVFGGNVAAPGPRKDFNRTMIGGVEPEGGQSVPGQTSEAPRATRKIVGWIISFTIDPMGVDYRLYEGTNTIGREPGNSITITRDGTIGGKHATILYRGGKFWVRDEMSANGTYVNGEELIPGNPFPVEDGAEIRCASTVFKFRSAE